jgi:hypothetical protein
LPPERAMEKQTRLEARPIGARNRRRFLSLLQPAERLQLTLPSNMGFKKSVLLGDYT